MKKYLYRYRGKDKTKKIIGAALGLIGFLIILIVIPIKFLFFLIGICLLLVSVLLLIK